ncbi:PadR family transcriptional regulator [Sulfolobus sp. E5-1-F]|uniref:PadR family transcriptional regulator n=1 Tax=Sulfolobaceae TaxID=118883 RepID=UPI00129534E0|nr:MULTISPECIES: PadR family transcriptional regulator [unclassified Sulfolobus]QGA55118.1 PadR family transcriptional regulator [Sulfolobus sp. E5-1-F]QGA67926.1 PadR family transcriptional regulator [Sulfolobus sp. E11-6]
MFWHRRRGLKWIILYVLSKGPMTGAQIMDEIEKTSYGMWRPSPGSVYPALDALEAEGLIRISKIDGWKKFYELTEEGRRAIGAMSEEDKVKEAIEQLEFSARYIVENLEKLSDEDKRKVKNILDELSKVMR